MQTTQLTRRLRIAASQGNLTIVKAILALSINPNAIPSTLFERDLQQSTLQKAIIGYRALPQRTAAERQVKAEKLLIYQNIITTLLKAGADPSLPQPHNNALTEARRQPELLRLLTTSNGQLFNIEPIR